MGSYTRLKYSIFLNQKMHEDTNSSEHQKTQLVSLLPSLQAELRTSVDDQWTEEYAKEKSSKVAQDRKCKAKAAANIARYFYGLEADDILDKCLMALKENFGKARKTEVGICHGRGK